MKFFVDSLSRKVEIPFPPQRIISLCPSQTELLFDLGLEKQVIGRTRWCIHPKEKVQKVEIVGGTKNPDENKILDLKPDLILCEKEENTKDFVERMQLHFPVFVTDVKTISSALSMIESVGKITGKEAEANVLLKAIRNSFSSIAGENRGSVLYFIWKKPWMLAGRETYINDVLKELGFENLGCNYEGRYPEWNPSHSVENQPDYIFLSSEPYPFSLKNIEEIQFLFPKSQVLLVNGEWFSWYGSRMLIAARELKTWLQQLDRR